MKRTLTHCIAILFVLICATDAGAQLSGNYTIDPGSSGTRNYKTIKAAVNALKSSGVSAPVVFSIRSGTYRENVELVGKITGASASSTVTFKSQTGNRNDVTITDAGNSVYDAVLLLEKVEHTIWKDLSIKVGNGRSGVLLTEKADYHTFQNIHVVHKLYDNGSVSFYLQGASYNTIIECEVNGGDDGIFLNAHGRATKEPTTHNRITNTRFYNQATSGLKAWNAQSLTVDQILVDSLKEYAEHAIFLGDCRNGTVLSNSQVISLNGPRGGVQLHHDNQDSKGDTSWIFNNMFRLAGSLAIVKCVNSMWYNNSIDVQVAPWLFGSFGSYLTELEGCKIVNNNWKSVGPELGCLIDKVKSNTTIAYNNVDWSGPDAWARVDGTDYQSLSDQVKNEPNLNNNSLDVSPGFLSNTNLRSFSPDLNNIGTSVPFRLKKDVDGNPRPATDDIDYDIGCNEFSLFTHDHDLDIKEIKSPSTSDIKEKNNVVTIGLINSGKVEIENETVQIAYSIDSGKTFFPAESYAITNLSSGQTIDFSFSRKWSPQRFGEFGLLVQLASQIDDDPDTLDRAIEYINFVEPVYDLDAISLSNEFNTADSCRVKISLKNNGNRLLHGQVIDLSYSIDSGKTYFDSESVTLSSLSPGQTFEYSFAKKWEPNRFGDFEIRGKIETGVDNDPDSLDEISIVFDNPRPNGDLDLRLITSPEIITSTPYAISVRMKNEGTTLLANEEIVLSYSTDSGKTYAVSQNHLIKNLGPGKNSAFTFDQSWTPKRYGAFRIYVKIENQVFGDPDPQDVTYLDVNRHDPSNTEIPTIKSSIFPNPTSGQLNINVDLAKADRVRVSIINALGQEVLVVADQYGNAINKTVDLSSLAGGVYNVKIVSGDQSLVKRVTLTK